MHYFSVRPRIDIDGAPGCRQGVYRCLNSGETARCSSAHCEYGPKSGKSRGAGKWRVAIGNPIPHGNSRTYWREIYRTRPQGDIGILCGHVAGHQLVKNNVVHGKAQQMGGIMSFQHHLAFSENMHIVQ